MKKKLTALLCAAALCLLCACGASQSQTEEDCFRLYYPRPLEEADGGDAIAWVGIPWEQLPQENQQEQAQAVMALLLGGCREENFRSPVPAGTQLNSCTVQGTTAVVDFLGSYGQLSGMDLTLADYCVTLSLTQLPYIYAVRITVGGQDLEYRDTSRFLASDVLLTSTEDVVRTLTARLYFPDSDGVLQMEERLLTLYEGESRGGVVLSALAGGPERSGLDVLLPEGFAPQMIRTENGICYVNLNSEEISLLEGREGLILAGITDSLCSLEGVGGVQFLLDGEFQMSLGQADISGPMTAEIS